MSLVYIELFIFDLFKCYEDLDCCVLLIFVLLFGVDFMVSLVKFVEDIGMNCGINYEVIKLFFW